MYSMDGAAQAAAVENARCEGATHLLIVCDTFSNEDYPVAVMPGELERRHSEFSNNMQRVVETIEIQSEPEARLSRINAELTALEKDYRCVLLASNFGDGLKIRFALTKHGTFVPPARKSKAKKTSKRSTR